MAWTRLQKSLTRATVLSERVAVEGRRMFLCFVLFDPVGDEIAESRCVAISASFLQERALFRDGESDEQL
ncbi:MAG: hypothetical protein QOJ42_8091 [Acidobacteriaceae bacterium]|jgi:hypothetical protein|nr:hypothetical protein [Acidobacteriaceae bacterium]MDT7818175.1 hypothetical protein [Acidobacteriaceae bacterium]